MNANHRSQIRTAATQTLLNEGWTQKGATTFERTVDDHPCRVFVSDHEVALWVYFPVNAQWEHATSRPIEELGHLLAA